MGDGRTFICKHCNKEHDIYFGIGFMFPITYREKVEEIRAGKYGEEWKELFNSKEFVAVDAQRYLYYCKKCGHWEDTTCMDLYEAKHLDKVRKTQKSTDEADKVDKTSYVMDYELKRDWKLLKAYEHNCPNCNKPMAWTDDCNDKVLDGIKCPDCGNIMEDGGIVTWD